MKRQGSQRRKNRKFTKNVGTSTKYTSKGMVHNGKTPGRAQLVIRLGGKAFTFDSEKLARVRKIRAAKRALSVPQSENGRR